MPHARTESSTGSSPATRLSDMSKQTPSYSCELAIRWSDFDKSGDITDTTYIQLAYEARMSFMRNTWLRRGLPVPPMAVKHLEVDYLKPLLVGMERVIVNMSVEAVTKTSYTLRHEITDTRGDVLAVVDCVLVSFDSESRRQVQLEPAVQLMLTELKGE